MPPKKDTRKRETPKINWVFRLSADPELITDEDRNNEATDLFGTLIEHCECFAYQLESAPTTGYLHYQGYMKLVNKKRFSWIQTHLRKFEYLDGMKGKPNQAWAYATKEETRLLGPWEFGEPGELTTKVDTTYKEALEAPTVREGINIIMDKKPRDYCLYGSAIQRNLEASKKKAFKKPYSLTDFNRAPLDFKKTSHVYGPSGTGKTSFVTAHFENPLFVRHIEALKKLSPDNDAIIFDDMSFLHWPTESVIALVDQDFDSDINVRYTVVNIPANTKKVFTHNMRDIFYKPECNEEQKAAIDRRVDYFQVPNKLFAVKGEPVPNVVNNEMDEVD